MTSKPDAKIARDEVDKKIESNDRKVRTLSSGCTNEGPGEEGEGIQEFLQKGKEVCRILFVN